MQTFRNSFISIALLLLAVATYVVLAGRTPATPATADEPTPTSCLSQSHECVTATFLGYTHHTDGTTTLSYRITNNCAETVETIAIETGRWTRLAPTDGSRYSGNLGDYTTAWIGPVGDILTQGIRFTNASPDYHSGVSDEFTITVRDFVPESPNTIRVVTDGDRLNSYSFRWMLLDPSCENGVDPLPSPTATATFTPTATLDPAIPTATWEYYPTPESCLSQSHECVTATFLGYSHHADGTTTLTYRITNNCAETVETVAIETGHWSRIAPTDGGSYTGQLGNYATQWIGPVGDILTQGIRFTNASPDYHSGMSDDFTITVRDFVPESPNTIRVVTKKSGINHYSFRWMLLDPSCENGVDPTPRPLPTSTPTVTPTPTDTPTVTPTATDTATPRPTATQPQSPLPTVTRRPSPTYTPGPSPTPLPTLDPAMFPGRISPTATLLPDVGIRLGEIKTFDAVPEIPYDDHFESPAFVDLNTDGKTIVGVAVNRGKSQYFGSIVTIDIATGASQKIADLEDANEPKISGQYIVWEDASKVHVYNRQSDEYRILHPDDNSLRRFVALSDHRLAWHYSKDPMTFSPEDGIWSHDLTTGEEHQLAGRLGQRPLISQQWVLYPNAARLTEVEDGYLVSLEAANIDTGETVTVGTVHDADIRINFSPGKFPYAIDMPWIAWAPNTHTITEVPSLYLYNVETQATRIAPVPACALRLQPDAPEGGGRISYIIISGDLVLFKGCSQPMGYVISRDIFFSVPIDHVFNPRPNTLYMIGWALADNQLVWALTTGTTPHTMTTHIFAAPIIGADSP